MAKPTHSFGEFEVDEATYELRQSGHKLAIEPKALELLSYLIRSRERVVSKDELLDRVWAGVSVSESVLPTHVRTLRKLLGDDRSRQAVIQTVYGRGYRFVAALAETPELARATQAGPALDAARPRRPSPATPLVGRGEVLAELVEAFDAARRGDPTVCLLVGEPGIGKTRLSEELVAHVAAADSTVLVLQGRCHEEEGAPAYWPWQQVLSALLREHSPEEVGAGLGSELAALAPVLPELSGGAPGTDPNSMEVAPRDRFRLFEAVARLLERRSRERCLLILLEDLHWSDRASLRLLLFLVRELGSARVMMLGTYRNVELRRRHPLAKSLTELAREERCLRWLLPRLDEEAVSELVSHASTVTHAGTTAADRLATRLSELSEGNPFFVLELLHLLEVEGEPQTGQLLPQRLPEGIREVIGQRLDRLSPECNDLLAIASVVGREFDFGIVRQVAELDDSALLDLLDEAVSARVVEEIGEGVARFRFSHALIREALHAELALPRRVRLHRTVAEVLERIHARDLIPHLAELAHHFFLSAAGGSAQAAIDYGRRAAAHSSASFAYDEAVLQLDRVRQVADLEGGVEEAERCEIELELGEALARAGERVRGREVFGAVARRARSAGRDDLFARAAVGFGMHGEWGAPGDEELRLLLEEALERLEPERLALRAMVLARLCATAHYSSSIEVCTRMAREAVELATQSGDIETLSYALRVRIFSLDSLETSGQLAHASELLEIARGFDKTGARVQALDLRRSAYEERYIARLIEGRMRDAEAELSALEGLADGTRDLASRWGVTWHHFGRCLAEARFGEADTWLKRCRELAERIEIPLAPLLPRLFRVLLVRERGAQACPPAEFEELVDLLRRAPDLLGGYHHPLHALAASTLLAAGREDEARSIFSELVADGLVSLSQDGMGLFTLALLAELSHDLGDVACAAGLLERLRPHADLNVTVSMLRVYIGSARHFVGLLEAAMGRHEAARQEFEKALEANLAMGSTAHVTRTRLRLGALLAVAPVADQRKRGRSLIEQAATDAESLGMLGLLGDARRLLSA